MILDSLYPFVANTHQVKASRGYTICDMSALNRLMAGLEVPEKCKCAFDSSFVQEPICEVIHTSNRLSAWLLESKTS